ncbi:hypothetical protein SAMN05216551_10952 [Chitinasiproducens palmae]|uniref:Uncharacterized protein n=1 Tax=Chitinasiproducens palmae TaxID=1770053 RepID=A0A1H2PSU6_9BURK|nr:hypothetical protein SAMN05216551_10952 [Chitinasiproducens palmae]
MGGAPDMRWPRTSSGPRHQGTRPMPGTMRTVHAFSKGRATDRRLGRWSTTRPAARGMCAAVAASRADGPVDDGGRV